MAINADNPRPLDAPLLLVMQNIVKRFGPVTALNGVDLDVQAGEIHALLGENGAGKSTLMHILAGLTLPTSGGITLDGRTLRLPTPRSARCSGIAMVHQHFTLVPAFTVEENLALDASAQNDSTNRAKRRPLMAARGALDRAAALGWHLDARARVSALPVGTQQRVEIVKALATNARILIFDEPTAVLAGAEVEELFGVLRRLRDEGHAVILIAHKLAEIMAVADRVSVLRRGSNVATVNVKDTDPAQLAQWMIGSLPDASLTNDAATVVSPASAMAAPNPPMPRSQAANPLLDTLADAPVAADNRTDGSGSAPVFIAANLTVYGDRGETALRGVSLTVHAGEILGVGGVDGNGQTELAETLVGLRPLVSGAMTWQGRLFQPGTTPHAGYIPQDRRRAGLAMTLSVEENLLLEAARDPAYRRGPFLQRRRLTRLAQTLMRDYDIRAHSGQIAVSTLSGGNQQKIVVARALHARPPWIVAVNPTRGLDIGAARFVHAQLLRARASGAAIVLISTDLDELAALSDRQAILSGGQLSAYTPGVQDAAQLGLLLGGMANRP